MITLSQLTNTHRPKKKVQRVGRGMGSKRGKTCWPWRQRAIKHDPVTKALWPRRGQIPLYQKISLPEDFQMHSLRILSFAINLGMIEQIYKDGETVNLETLQRKRICSTRIPGGLKILSDGEINKESDH